MRGFSLVEMMVSTALVGIVSAGIMQVVLIANRTQSASARIDVAQSGVRAGLEYITRDVEMASAGARTGQIVFGTGTPAQLLAVSVTNSSTAPDRIDLVLIDPGAQSTAVAPFAPGQSSITVDTPSSFVAGDLVQLCDLSTATLLRITTVGSTTLSVTAPSNPLPVPSYPAGSYVFRSKVVSYYVDTTFFGAQDPLLMMDPDGPSGPQAGQPLAEGVEDFQVALGFDLDGDGIIQNVGASAGDDEWIFNVAGETAPATLAGLKAVRVTLVARTTSQEAGLLGRRPAAEDRPGAATADGFLRRVVHSEIAVRNFNL